LYDQKSNSSKFAWVESEVYGQSRRIEPELGREIVAINVHVRWLNDVVAEEVDPEGPISNIRRHARNPHLGLLWDSSFMSVRPAPRSNQRSNS